MKEKLMKKFENQVEKLFDTLLEIEKEEQEAPIRELSNRHKATLGMIFFNQVLIKSCWNTKLKDLTQLQALKYVGEVGEMTAEHYLNLYGFDVKKTANDT